jgi:hypothetical protein
MLLRPPAAAVCLAALVACLCACTPGSGELDARRDLVGEWRFDEGAGNAAADSSGHDNTARLSRAAWGPGRSGSALALDGGNDDSVRVPLSASLRRTRDAITVAAWTYRDATHNVAVVSHGYPALFFGFHGEQFKWQFEREGGRQTACYADPKHIAAPGRWIHVAATYDGWSARLYANGEEICRDWTSGALTMPEVPFTIGGYLEDSGRIVDEITGRIDDVRIYARALSAAEIRKLRGATRE